MSALTQMLEKWEARSRGANPCEAMLINKHLREVRELLAANAVSEPQVEQADLYGTKDGVLVHLGKAAMPPRMKARELAKEQFGHFEDDDGSDADLCFYALERLIEHMYAQGFKIANPQATEPQAVASGITLAQLVQAMSERDLPRLLAGSGTTDAAAPEQKP